MRAEIGTQSFPRQAAADNVQGGMRFATLVGERRCGSTMLGDCVSNRHTETCEVLVMRAVRNEEKAEKARAEAKGLVPQTERPPTVGVLGRLRAPLKRFVKYRLDDRLSARVDASDVVQDTYLEASQRLEDLADLSGSSLLNMLKKIAGRRVIDSYRRHVQAKRRSVLRERPADAPLADQSRFRLIDTLAASTSTAGTKAIRREALNALREGLAKLSPGDRQLLVLRHLEQRTVEEIADLLHTSRTVVTTRHLRAIRRLRRILKSQLEATVS
jgi:RNA polymerase sigma-70 factor (ECF subfamily)